MVKIVAQSECCRIRAYKRRSTKQGDCPEDLKMKSPKETTNSGGKKEKKRGAMSSHFPTDVPDTWCQTCCHMKPSLNG